MEYLNYNNYNDYSFLFEKTDEWMKYLKNNGFVVLKNIVDNEICDKYKDELWKVIKLFSKVDLEDKNNKKYAKNYPYALHGGMYNFGHLKTQWNARYKCKKIFEKIWDDNNLVTSFDKFVYCPKERTYRNTDILSWIHSDQSYLNNIISYQGTLCLTDNLKYNSGGFVCIPKSHINHKDVCIKNGNENDKRDWVKLTDDFKKKYLKNENVLKVKNKKGDFILWDSKTLHSGMVPINKNNLRYDRVGIYICMRKRDELNNRNIKRRIKAFNEKRSTTHNPCKFKLFEKNLGRHSNTKYEEIINKLKKNKLIIEEINNLV